MGSAIVKVGSRRLLLKRLKSIDKGRRYREGKRLRKKVVTSLDFQEEVSTGYAEGVYTAEGEEASLAEAIRLDTFGERRREVRARAKRNIANDPITAENIYDEITLKNQGGHGSCSQLKGLHSDKTDEDESEASKDADPISGTNIPINPVLVAIKPPSIATYKIIKQGKEGVYQIVREDGTDIVYINFGAMLKDITRDDLTELYRIVMNRYGMNGPEDELEKVLWEYLKNMFEAPLSTDPIWSSLGQQRIISWRYYSTCRVHCLNLESSDIYMLTERKYPLTAEVCKAMLDKKLQGGKPDEDCYKLLKWMEKQAGIRKHKDWLVQEQTALGKDFSNPLMADNLPKIVWLSTHHIWLDVPTQQILDSKGAIPTKTTADAKVAIQDMAEFSQKWHNRTSLKTRSTKTSNGLDAIQA
ncbi:hypothetical protein Tco_0633200 [Tanacetum coccineum]